jgi:hypothetical protein
MTTLVSRLAASFRESGSHVVSAYLVGRRARAAEHLDPFDPGSRHAG